MAEFIKRRRVAHAVAGWATLGLALVFEAPVARGVDGGYAIVVSEATRSDDGWRQVVAALVDKYPQAEVVGWTEQVDDALAGLRAARPRYACFVARPDEAGRRFVAAVHRLTRRLDDDPYADVQWGILTGYDADNARRIAAEREPLRVQRVAAGTEVALEMCEQGEWYDELVQSKHVRKQVSGAPEQVVGPPDTTRALADTLTEHDCHLFVTSGHATERDWQIGFSYRNGQFVSRQGTLYGRPTDGPEFAIRSQQPRAYLAVGNCLMGHIDGPDAMALAWLNSAGVRQMAGYTVVTWYGYAGWGLLDYFVEQPGRYTLAEAFHANQAALIHRLATYFDGALDVEFEAGDMGLPAPEPNAAGRAAGLSAMDGRGLLWDRDVVALYGDPAWPVKMAPGDAAYDQELAVEGDVITLRVTPRRGAASFAPINENGSQRGGRPIFAWLPHRIGPAEVLAGADHKPVITDDFVLVPRPAAGEPAEPFEIRFRAGPEATPPATAALSP